MTTAIIGTGGLGSAIVRQLAAGGEALQLSSADTESARKPAVAIGGAVVVALDNRSALQGADTVVLALRFTVLQDVIDEIADGLGDTTLVIPSNPVGLDAQGKVVRRLPEGQSSGQVVAGWLPIGTRFAIAFGTMSADLFESSSHRSPEFAVLFYVSEDEHGSEKVERLIRSAGFVPIRIGGSNSRADLRWAAIFTILWSGPQRRGPSSLGPGPLPTWLAPANDTELQAKSWTVVLSANVSTLFPAWRRVSETLLTLARSRLDGGEWVDNGRRAAYL